LDGIQECVGFNTNTISSQGGLLLGRGPQPSDIYTGIIDEFGIWKDRVLSSSDVTQLFNQVVQPCYNVDVTGVCVHTTGISGSC
jgi:hypothetical protein